MIETSTIRMQERAVGVDARVYGWLGEHRTMCPGGLSLALKFSVDLFFFLGSTREGAGDEEGGGGEEGGQGVGGCVPFAPRLENSRLARRRKSKS